MFQLKRKTQRNIIGYLIIFPSLIIFGVFKIWPMIWGAIISLFNWDGFTKMTYVGFKNYIELLTKDNIFPTVITNTLIYAVGIIIGNIVISLLLALLVNRKMRGSSIFRAIYFLPPIMSFVMVGLLWAWIYNPQFGLINSFLSTIGLGFLKQSWLSNPKTALASLMLIDVWKWSGWHMVIYLAGLQTISQDVMDAAKIDGASGFRHFSHIIWPLLMPYTLLNIVLIAVGAFNTFDIVYVTTRGGPYYATQMMLTYVQMVAFKYHRIGYAAAMTYFLFFIVFCISITNAILLHRRDKERRTTLRESI